MDRRKRWVSAFIIWHWALAIPWLLPYGSAMSVVRVFSDMYYMSIGTWQAWYMFSGAPRGSSHMVSTVELDDGRELTFELPTVAHMGRVEAWWGYRYREFEHRLSSGHRLHVVLPERAWDAWSRYVVTQVELGGASPERVVLSHCGLPTPTQAEVRAESDWVDYTALLRDASRWQCEVFYTAELGEGGTP
jgi:hypothetical protein